MTNKGEKNLPICQHSSTTAVFESIRYIEQNVSIVWFYTKFIDSNNIYPDKANALLLVGSYARFFSASEKQTATYTPVLVSRIDCGWIPASSTASYAASIRPRPNRLKCHVSSEMFIFHNLHFSDALQIYVYNCIYCYLADPYN